MFEWDSLKAAANERKHGVGFEEAATCFSDPEVLMLHDLAHSRSEDRYITIAQSEYRRVLVIVFTMRRGRYGKKVFRIISARQANKRERAIYPRSQD